MMSMVSAYTYYIISMVSETPNYGHVRSRQTRTQLSNCNYNYNYI